MPEEALGLQDLRDIVTPETVSWWPAAPGWWILAGFFALLGVLGAVRQTVRRHRDAYRRAGLAELKAMGRNLPREGDLPTEAAAALSELLKRVALAGWRRETVASLTGESWLEFLDATGGTNEFTRGPGRVLRDVSHRPGSVARADWSPLLELCARWIRDHERSRREPGNRESDSSGAAPRLET